MSGTSTRNHRILVVDDNPEIHRDFVRVLTSAAKPALEALDAQLFGERPQRHAPAYLIESASQGEQAVEMARAAIARGEPYDLAFVDARMPPGMDGVQTIAQLWELDHSLHVVLCSAYADYGWDEIAAAIGVTDRCLVLRKPFDPLEVRQLASALTHKTELLRVQTDHVARLDQLVRERTSELEAALESLRAEGVHRAEMERALAHAQRMQALGQLTAGIAHEINNPLLVVRGHLEMIEDELDHRGLDDLIRPVQATIAAANRIANVVRDVRSFATPQDGPVEPVEIAPVIESALGLLGVLPAVGGGIADGPPAPRRFRGRAPAARNPCWSHCPFPGLIGTITPALRGGTSRAAPHVRGTDRRVARPPTSGAGLGAWLRCPVVNGAGADRYWPVGSGGHGPFVRSHLAVRGHDDIAARRGCLRWDSCCWFARPVSAGCQRGRPGRRTRCGQLAGHAARRPR